MTPPAAATSATNRTRTGTPRPSIAPRRPRRVSGPARSAPVAPPRRAQSERGLALGLLEALTRISHHQRLDRLIRGRTWIALIAFALIGIVTLQLLVLTLNARIGRVLVHQAQLQRENATLSIESSELAAGERVESLAARLGMELVQVGAVRFLSVDSRADIARAAAAVSASPQTSSTGTGEVLAEPAAEASAAAAVPGASDATEAAAAEQAATTAATAPAQGEAATGATGETTPGANAQAAPGASDEAPAGAAAGSGASAEGASTAGAASATGAAGGTQSSGAG